MQVDGKSAVVTGAASGLGFEFAKLLASDGYSLYLVDIDEVGLHKTADLLTFQYGAKAESLLYDLATPDAAAEIYSRVDGNEVEVLINNAGFGLCGRFDYTDWHLEERMIFLNVLTSTQLTKLFLPGMVTRGHGKIMNVSSLAAFQPGPLMAIYYATKAYLLSFTQAVACELNGTGVSLTVFCPGMTRTGFQAAVARNSNMPLSKCPWLADAGVVAAYGYRAMMKGKMIAVPGGRNKMLAQAHRFLPASRITQIMKILQDKVRNQ